MLIVVCWLLFVGCCLQVAAVRCLLLLVAVCCVLLCEAVCLEFVVSLSVAGCVLFGVVAGWLQFVGCCVALSVAVDRRGSFVVC